MEEEREGDAGAVVDWQESEVSVKEGEECGFAGTGVAFDEEDGVGGGEELGVEWVLQDPGTGFGVGSGGLGEAGCHCWEREGVETCSIFSLKIIKVF
jgi:hypothetical protein